MEFRMDGSLQYMVWYHAVGLIWISEFILACQQMTVAGAVVTYYFTRSEVKGHSHRKKLLPSICLRRTTFVISTVSLSHCRDKSQMPFTPIVSSMLRLMRYHLGTVVKGAFIITLVEIPRLILTYIHSQLKGKVSHCQNSFVTLMSLRLLLINWMHRWSVKPYVVAVGERLCALYAEGVHLLSVVSRKVPCLPKHGESNICSRKMNLFISIWCINHFVFSSECIYSNGHQQHQLLHVCTRRFLHPRRKRSPCGSYQQCRGLCPVFRKGIYSQIRNFPLYCIFIVTYLLLYLNIYILIYSIY